MTAIFYLISIGMGMHITIDMEGAVNSVSSTPTFKEETKLYKQDQMERLNHEVWINSGWLYGLILGCTELEELFNDEEALEWILSLTLQMMSEVAEVMEGDFSHNM